VASQRLLASVLSCSGLVTLFKITGRLAFAGWPMGLRLLLLQP
jgi:hypothetical protein